MYFNVYLISVFKIAIQSEVTLTNGTIIKVDGTIIKKDGFKIVMAVDECADEEGNRITTEKQKKFNNQNKNYEKYFRFRKHRISYD